MELKVGMRVENDVYGKGVVDEFTRAGNYHVKFDNGKDGATIYSLDGRHYFGFRNDPAYTLREVVEDPNPMPELEAGMVVETEEGKFYIALPHDGRLGFYRHNGSGSCDYRVIEIQRMYQKDDHN